MKTKKIPYYFLLLLLALGATITIGFLSFGGMYVILPILPLAALMFFFSISYEGQIYVKNIKEGFDTFRKRNVIERDLARDYLSKNFPKDTNASDCPQFFRDYMQQLQALEQLRQQKPSKVNKKKKKKIKKTLSDMDKWFALQLFSEAEESDLTAYESGLRAWLMDSKRKHIREEYQKRRTQRRRLFRYAIAFGILAGIFMGISTSYLLVGEIALIPFIALLPAPFILIPAIIIPLALIAGIAYGVLIINTINNMIKNETVQKWYRKFRKDFSKGITPRNIIMATLVVFLVGLTVALTICTAGTWWTIAKTARPLFPWMVKIPSFVMGVINPIITGFSALLFNVENTLETLEMFYSAAKKGFSFVQEKWQRLMQSLKNLWQREHWLQLLNPFRLLLKVTLTPLRIICFLAHLVSIGVTSDRVPGIPAILSALLGIISEGFEDAHYFIEQDEQQPAENEQLSPKQLLKRRFKHEHGHSHENDIPTRILKFLFIPVYVLATAWDYWTSGLSNNPLTFMQAWHKQTGTPKHDVERLLVLLIKPFRGKNKASQQSSEEVQMPPSGYQPVKEEEQDCGVKESDATRCDGAIQPSSEGSQGQVAKQTLSQDWQREHACFKIERFERHFDYVLVDRETAKDKKAALDALQQELKHNKDASPKEIIDKHIANPIYAKHRLFKQGPTETTEFLQKLAQQL